MDKFYAFLERYFSFASLFIGLIIWHYNKIIVFLFTTHDDIRMHTINQIAGDNGFYFAGPLLAKYVLIPIFILWSLILAFRKFGWLKTGIFLITIFCFFRYFHFLMSWVFYFDR